MKDTLRRFLFENLAVRGELVHLDESWKEVIQRHRYPLALQSVIGELMSAVVLLIATLKFNGKLIAQIQGNGPVKLLVVEGTSDRTVRATASCQQDEINDASLKGLFGNGRFVITIEPDEGERYQGIVELTGDTIADALTDYLLRSEQLDTGIWLAADETQAAGLLVQKLPGTDHVKNMPAEEDSDGWNRIMQLSSTISSKELLELNADEIIHRLFHEEDVRVFAEETVEFHCSCSRERVGSMLRSLGEEEIRSILAEQGNIEVNCEFCNQKYRFDIVDAEQLLTTSSVETVSERKH